ncbi:MAG: hypothetical protein RL141_569 [Candidatus Parcubacteria bacterium]|jgi:hypothetical protein
MRPSFESAPIAPAERSLPREHWRIGERETLESVARLGRREAPLANALVRACETTTEILEAREA